MKTDLSDRSFEWKTFFLTTTKIRNVLRIINNFNSANGLKIHTMRLKSIDIYFPLKLFFLRFIIILSKILTTESVEDICPGFRIKEIGGIDCQLRKEILQAHNEIRQNVAAGLVDGQPPAINMRRLYWDEELAAGAQDWANHCTFKHNDLSDREIARFKVGQNIALTKNRGRSPEEKEFSKQVKNWFNEYTIYNFDRINEEHIKSSGHYTQLIWAETYLIGCGYSRFEDLISNISCRLYVCHYGPSGNVRGEKPYEIGNRNCPDDTLESSKYDALCALKSAPRDNCKSLNIPREKDLWNARRSEWYKNDQSFNNNRRNLSPVKLFYEYNNDRVEPFDSDDVAFFIFLRYVLRI